ncbi:MAG: hypothetical protein KF861_13790 [Planctomycetaceae bacterium]|nr:hypothetical protein [Planctomycetaceae bacterium]
MGLISWDGIYGESDTFIPEEDAAAAAQDAKALLREHPYRDSSNGLPDLGEARRRKLLRGTDPR